MTFSMERIALLDDSLNSESGRALLRAGSLPSPPGSVRVRLCAVHWFDLSFLAGVAGNLEGRDDWRELASALLRLTCTAAEWDWKEISNLLRWQRVPLV